MIVSTLRKVGVTSDSAHVERFGIFIGLWAPTFMALADGVKQQEVVES